MITKIIGIKKFRENITSLWKEAKKEKIKYIIMHHSEPIFEVTPIVEDELILEKYAKDIAEAREEVKRGEVYTDKEIRKLLGLNELETNLHKKSLKRPRSNSKSNFSKNS